MKSKPFIMVALATMLATVHYASAADRDFESMVQGASIRLNAQSTRIPMMGLISFCARVASKGGVKGLHVAVFEHLTTPLELADLTSMLHAVPDAEWRPFVTESSRQGGEQTAIFVRSEGHAFRMLIADYESSELNFVELKLDAKALAKWVKDPEGEAHRRKGNL